MLRAPVRRFPVPFMWLSGASSELADVDADEIHVHLLARDDVAANAVLDDLQEAFVESRQTVSLAA